MGDLWYVKKFDNFIKLFDLVKQPIENISYYEAEAFCNYKNAFLPELDDLKLLFFPKVIFHFLIKIKIVC